MDAKSKATLMGCVDKRIEDMGHFKKMYNNRHIGDVVEQIDKHLADLSEAKRQLEELECE